MWLYTISGLYFLTGLPFDNSAFWKNSPIGMLNPNVFSWLQQSAGVIAWKNENVIFAIVA